MCKSAKGFTLIELIVSIAILGLMVFGMAVLFPRGLATVAQSEALTSATNLGQAQLETVLGQDYQHVTTGIFETRHPVGNGFERQTEITLIDPATLQTTSTDLGLKRATVTVWYATTSGTKSLTLSTLIVQR